jgi:hypothetical protein
MAKLVPPRPTNSMGLGSPLFPHPRVELVSQCNAARRYA